MATKEPDSFANGCYTEIMGEAADKDSIRSLFEPMPAEALDRRNGQFPISPPLSLEQRRESLEWLLAPEGGNVRVSLRPPYNNGNYRDQLIESMLLNEWFLPDTALGNRLPLQGTSVHKVGSSTVPISPNGDITRRVDVVVKPFKSKNFKAERELDLLERISARGIPAVQPLGVIDIDDKLGHDTFILTILKKGIVPLQRVHFERLNVNNNFEQLRRLFESLGEFAANVHNNGIIHNDLHPGNIGADLNQESEEEFILFDMEKAEMMAADKLGVKNKVSAQPTEAQMKKFRAFEEKALKDIANLAAHIVGNNEHLPYDVVLHYLVLPYLRARRKSHGQFDQDQYVALFDRRFKKRLGWVRDYVERNQSALSELISA